MSRVRLQPPRSPKIFWHSSNKAARASELLYGAGGQRNIAYGIRFVPDGRVLNSVALDDGPWSVFRFLDDREKWDAGAHIRDWPCSAARECAGLAALSSDGPHRRPEERLDLRLRRRDRAIAGYSLLREALKRLNLIARNVQQAS